jgi:hypothetical protein
MADGRRSAWRQTHHHYRLDRSCDHERRGLQRDRHCRGGARLRWPRLRARGRIGHLLGRRRGVGPESRIWGPSFFSWTRVERGIQPALHTRSSSFGLLHLTKPPRGNIIASIRGSKRWVAGFKSESRPASDRNPQPHIQAPWGRPAVFVATCVPLALACEARQARAC